MGGGSPKRGNYWVGYTWGVTGPNYSPNQAQNSQDSHVREIEEDNLPEKLEKQILLEILEISHQDHKVEGWGGL